MVITGRNMRVWSLGAVQIAMKQTALNLTDPEVTAAVYLLERPVRLRGKLAVFKGTIQLALAAARRG